MLGYNKKLATEYSKNRHDYTFMDASVSKLMSNFGIQDKCILDFGCGDGIHSIEFANQMAKSVVGIDVSEDMIKFAQKKLSDLGLENVKFQVADGNTLPFQENTFDLVFANYVLVAFDKLEIPLKEISRVLKPSGSLLATVNSATIADEKIANKPIPIRLGKTHVVVEDYLHSELKIRKTLEKVGLDINVYEKKQNPDGIVDPSFSDIESVQDFHTAIFVAQK